MRSQPLTIPTEQQSLEALTQFREALTNMGQLRQNLTSLREAGFPLLPKSRRLKVIPQYKDTLPAPFNVIPCIKLCGDWLAEAGFEHNQHARIITLHQLLIICPEQLPKGIKR